VARVKEASTVYVVLVGPHVRLVTEFLGEAVRVAREDGGGVLECRMVTVAVIDGEEQRV